MPPRYNPTKKEVAKELIRLSRLLQSEARAEAYLREMGLLKPFTECPYCAASGPRRIRRQKYKCYRCRREWSARKGSFLESFRIPYRTFLLALKLFELEEPVRQTAKELGLAHNTTHRLFTEIRRHIYRFTSQDDFLKGEVEADESDFGGRRKGKRGRGAANKIPVFGILERRGKVKVEIIPDVKAETLTRLTVKNAKRSSLIYTDQFSSYHGLVAHGINPEPTAH